MRREMWAPLTGVAFIVVVIIGFIVGGEPPGADDPVQDIVNWYTDNKDSVQIGAVLGGLAGVLLIFFGAHLRRVLSAAEGTNGMLSVLPLVGLSVFAVGIAIDGTISFALAERVDDIDPVAVQALQALWDNDWLPLAVGIEVFLISTGISIVRYGALPKWLGWIALLLALSGLTPAGFAAFIGAGVLILIFSVMLTLRARSEAPQAV